MRPYLSENEILSIFGEDLFLKNDLTQTYMELLGYDSIKPFECVWEAEEVVLAFYESLKFYDWKTSGILEIFRKNILTKYDLSYFELLQKKFATISSDDIIPEKLKQILLKNI